MIDPYRASLGTSNAVSDTIRRPAANHLELMRPLLAAVVTLLAVALTAAASYFAFASDRSGTLAFWGIAAAPAITLGALSAVWAVREDYRREWLTPKWGDMTTAVVGGAALYAAAWLFVRTVAPVGSPREVWLVPLYGQIGDPRVLQAHAGIVAAWDRSRGAWRGARVARDGHAPARRAGRFRARRGSGLPGLHAVAYTPTLFALRAGDQLNPVLVVAAAGGGLFWGGMARVTGRLLPVVLAHAVSACAVVMMLPLWGPYALRL